MQPLLLAPRLDIGEDAAQHGIIMVADAGAEVSERALFPLARRLIDAGNPGLILDDSGLASRLRILYGDQIITVGPTSSARLNVMGGSTEASLRKLLRALRQRFYPHDRGDYWGSAVETDVCLLRRILRTVEGRDLTIADMHRVANDDLFVSQLVDQVRRKSPSLTSEIERQPPYSAWAARNGNQEMDNNRNWHYAFLRSALDQVWHSPFLRGAFCARAESAEAISPNATIVLDMPRGEWGSTVDFMGSALASWYDRLGRGGFLMTSGFTPALALNQLGRMPVIAAVSDIDSESIAQFGTSLLFSTTRPALLNWVTIVLGETITRTLALSARAGEGYALMRRTPSAAGAVTHGEFRLDRDPLWSPTSLGLRSDIHARMARISRAPVFLSATSSATGDEGPTKTVFEDAPNDAWRSDLIAAHPQLFNRSDCEIRVNDGWRHLVTDMVAQVDAAARHSDDVFSIWAICERQGTLQVQTWPRVRSGAVQTLVDHAIARAAKTCALCGAAGRIFGDGNSAQVQCEDHHYGRAPI